MPAKKKINEQDTPQMDMTALAGMLTQLVSSVQSLADEVKEIKQKQAEPASVQETMDEIQRRRKNYKSQAFKVLPYSWTYVDMNWEQKKNYRLPWLTFKTLEAANAYVAKHPWQMFDVVPV